MRLASANVAASAPPLKRIAGSQPGDASRKEPISPGNSDLMLGRSFPSSSQAMVSAMTVQPPTSTCNPPAMPAQIKLQVQFCLLHAARDKNTKPYASDF